MTAPVSDANHATFVVQSVHSGLNKNFSGALSDFAADSFRWNVLLISCHIGSSHVVAYKSSCVWIVQSILGGDKMFVLFTLWTMYSCHKLLYAWAYNAAITVIFEYVTTITFRTSSGKLVRSCIFRTLNYARGHTIAVKNKTARNNCSAY